VSCCASRTPRSGDYIRSDYEEKQAIATLQAIELVKHCTEVGALLPESLPNCSGRLATARSLTGVPFKDGHCQRVV
jgi:hypothetical protein